MPQRIQNIEPPLKGLDRSLGFQSQAPYTAYDMENVLPRERDYARLSMGSRPGLAKYGTPVASTLLNMLATVNVKYADKFAVIGDSFYYDTVANYSTVANFSTTRPSVSNRIVYNLNESSITQRCFYLPAPSNSPTLDTSRVYRNGIYIVPYSYGNTVQHVGTYGLIVAAALAGSPAKPDYDNSTRVDFAISGSTGAWTVTLYSRDGGVSTTVATASGTDGFAAEGWLEVQRTGTAFIVYWRGTAILSTPHSVADEGDYTCLLLTNSSTTVRQQVSRIRKQYYTATFLDSARTRLVASAQGTVYRETFSGAFTAAAGRCLLSNRIEPIQWAESGQKLYIADNPYPLAGGTDGVITGGNTFDSASYTNWLTPLTSTRPKDYLLQVDYKSGQSASGLLNSTYVYHSLDQPFTDGHYGQSLTVTITATGGTYTLSGVTGLSFTTGDGTADATMTFTGTKDYVAAAVTDSYFTGAGTTTYADVTYSVLGEGGKYITWTTKNSLASADFKTTGNPLPGFTTYEIDTIASGSLTIHGAVNGTGLTWRIIRGPKVYDVVADEETAVASGTDGAITLTTTFDSATYSNWETALAGRDLSKYDLQILSGSTVTASYPIIAIAAGGGTINIGTATNATGLTFQIVRNDRLAPLIASRGNAPVGCSLLARYQDRLVWAGDVRNPTNWFMSRQGDPTDYAYTDTDVGAAGKGTTQPAGKVGDPITALMPFNDDNFFFGCRNSLWLLRGNPAGGGRIDSVSHTTGVLGPNSWCHGPMGEMVWMSRDGVWMTNPQCMECEPIEVSKGRLPREFLDLNVDLTNCQMAYDQRLRGIIITLTPTLAGSSLGTYRHWFLHWETKGFFPWTAASYQNPWLLCPLRSNESEDNCVLIADTLGAISRFSRTADNDNGTAITAYMTIGPLKTTTSLYYRGIVRTLDVVMSETADDTTWTIYTADTAEGVASQTTAFMSGTFTEGSNYTIVPMMAGPCWSFKISGTGKWAFASAIATLSQYGADRNA